MVHVAYGSRQATYLSYVCISWFPQTELPRTCPLTGLADSSGRSFPHPRNEPLISIGRCRLAAAIGQVHEIECSSSNLLLHAPRTSRRNKTNLSTTDHLVLSQRPDPCSLRSRFRSVTVSRALIRSVNRGVFIDRFLFQSIN